MYKIIIGDSLNGVTVRDYFILKQYSVSQIKRFKYNGEIKVNGIPVTVRYRMKTGDVLELSTENRLLTPQFAPDAAKLLYCDKYLYLAEKPYGIPTHPDKANVNGTLGNMLAATFGDGFCLRIITRLDKTTSGIVLGALDEITAEKLNRQQQNRLIRKIYRAEVVGVMKNDNGTIQLPLLRRDAENKTVVDDKGKYAETEYEVVERRQTTTIVKLYPHTGRTHQLRAHMSAAGHPIVGDVLYGAAKDERIKLHCERLSFTHPYEQKTVDYCLPCDF
ncbi:MAG: RluA family pseudouridine synthase [Clostridia bacterium]|nr:RluA family pseudouridine synthase [Clostridia bacterium]